MKTFLTLFWIAVASSLYAQAYFDTTFTQHFQQDGPGWIASDGTISLALPDGRSMWFMGDSHVDQALNENGELPCLFNTRNSVLVQDSLERDLFTTYYNADGDDIYDRQFVKMEGDSNATYWPGDAIMIEDAIYSFWQKFEADPEAVFGISFSTMVIAKIKYPEVELIEVEAIQYPGVEYGMSVVWNEEDQYFYLYGKYLDWIVFKPMLARCTADQLLGEWEFYDGASWSTDPSAAAAIAPEASAAYSVFYLNEQYHLFYQESGYLECGLGRDMYIYSADNPWGPFEEKTMVYTMENQFEGEYPITYNGEAHPQFIENDELLISYNVNQLCPNDCQTTPFTSTYDPDRYRPKFARIPLCAFTKDVEAPIINCALDTVVLADSSGIFTFTDDSLAPLMSTDNCTDSVRISNSLNGTPSLMGSSLSPGTVEVVWTALDNSGNTNSCSMSITVDMPANTSEPDPKLAIQLYPNPATEKLYIADPNQIINHLSLYDASGKQLTPQLAGDGNALNVSSLAQGMYVLKLHLSDSILIKRFIVH